LGDGARNFDGLSVGCGDDVVERDGDLAAAVQAEVVVETAEDTVAVALLVAVILVVVPDPPGPAMAMSAQLR